MVYVLFTAHIQPDKLAEYHSLLEKFVPVVEKYGAKTLGIWQTVTGAMYEVMMLEAYEDMGNFQETRVKMEKDPLYMDLVPKMATMRTVDCQLLVPTPYSPLK